MDYCGSAPVRYSTRGLSEPCASIGSPPCRCKVLTSRVIRVRGNQWVRLRETQRPHSHGAMLKSGVGVGWARRTCRNLIRLHGATNSGQRTRSHVQAPRGAAWTRAPPIIWPSSMRRRGRKCGHDWRRYRDEPIVVVHHFLWHQLQRLVGNRSGCAHIVLIH